MNKEKFGSKEELPDFLDDKAEWLRKEMVRLSAIGYPEELYSRYEIDAAGIKKAVLNILKG